MSLSVIIEFKMFVIYLPLLHKTSCLIDEKLMYIKLIYHLSQRSKRSQSGQYCQVIIKEQLKMKEILT